MSSDEKPRESGRVHADVRPAAPSPKRGAGYTRYQATIRIENFYAYKGDEKYIKERLKRDVERELGCAVLEVSDVMILAQE